MKRMHREDRDAAGSPQKGPPKKIPTQSDDRAGKIYSIWYMKTGVSNRISTHQRFLSNGKRPTYIVFL